MMATDSVVLEIGGKKFTRGEVARGTGVSMSHISRIFSGKRVPSMRVVMQVAKFTGASIGQVIECMPSTQIQVTDTVEAGQS